MQCFFTKSVKFFQLTGELSEAGMINVVLKHIHKLVVCYAGFPKLSKAFMKVGFQNKKSCACCQGQLWAEKESVVPLPASVNITTWQPMFSL